METMHKLHCVSCGGTNLCFGYLGAMKNVFVPSGLFTMAGFRTRSFVCLDCGHIGQYIQKDRLKKLRDKFERELEDE
jgi:hypothetical protein